MNNEAELKGQKPDILLELLDWLKYILIAVLVGLLLVVFVIQRNSVIGDSMVPNLHQDDQLLVEKVSKLVGGIGYTDIITIKTDELRGHEGEPNIIKRVIGKPGDTIEIRSDGVYRNDVLLDEAAYLPENTPTEIRDMDFAKVELADDEYFVMGDNRTISLDSRSFGPVKLESIIGRVLIRFYPFEDFGTP